MDITQARSNATVEAAEHTWMLDHCPTYHHRVAHGLIVDVDDRYAAGQVVSHSKWRLEAERVGKAADILDRVDPRTDVIGIDEAQFFDAELVRVATVIYYPNGGWDGARDGGALRVFTASPPRER